MTQTRNTIRWILVLPACGPAWYAALFLGLLLLGAAKSFCPADQLVSGLCQAPWWLARSRVA